MTAIDDLRARLAEIGDLSRAAALLAWDERTMMPAAGGEARSNQHATLAKVRHEMFCDDEIGRLLESAAGDVDGAEPGESSEDSINADLVRLVSRDWEKARRVPSELRAEMARAGSIGEQAWVEARKASDFSILLPHLEKNVELARRYADCYEGFEDFSHPYDPLLDEYEPQMGTEAMRSVLGELREGLVPIVKEATEGEPASDGDVFRGEFPEAAQRELIAEMIGEMPFPEGGWRIDPTDHPFAITIGRGDVRLTTRYDDREPGDGRVQLDARGRPRPLRGQPGSGAGADPAREAALAGTARVPEPAVGELDGARAALSGTPAADAARALPERFDGVEVEQLHRDANRVERSLIRIEADEVTYNLHILIRFELELEIFDGELELADLPEAWNARYRDYLGLEVPDDARGVLQDVHWSGGAFGYFPTYSLGNVIAGQLWLAAARDLGDLDARIAAGDLAPLGEWLRDRVHRHGRRLTPAQILERAGCGELSVQPAAGPPAGAGRGRLAASVPPGPRTCGRSWSTPASLVFRACTRQLGHSRRLRILLSLSRGIT